MKSNHLLFLIATVFFFASCQRELHYDIDDTNSSEVIAQENARLDAAITNDTRSTYLRGTVLDEDQQPIEGAIVNCGGKKDTTDAKGYFNFEAKLTVNRDYAVIAVTKIGYMNGFRTFTPSASGQANHSERIILQEVGAVQTVSGSAGGVVTVDGQIKLTFPANAIVTSAGTAYTGQVQIVARYIDPNHPSFIEMIPGALIGLNDANRMQALQSYGMANVELLDAAGRKLQIAPGMKVKMEMPAAASAPATIPLWHFNEKFGVWIQSGTATKSGSTYTAEVNHFSTWNLDVEFNSFKLNVKIVDNNQVPLVGLRVWVQLTNGAYVHTFTTDNSGEAVLINCPSTVGMKFKAVLPCDSIIRDVAPVTADRTETIVYTPGAVSEQTDFTGTITGCNAQILANQPFEIRVNDGIRVTALPGVTDAQGKYRVSGITCQTATYIVQTMAFYDNTYHFSVATPVSTGTNTYNPAVCNTATGPSFVDTDPVNFVDANLERVIRAKINKPTGQIFYADVKNVQELRIQNPEGITNLEGLQYFTGMETFVLEANDITSLQPIRNIQALDMLHIAGTLVSDITPVLNLTGLTELGVSSNRITALPSLAALSGLNFLDLSDNEISDISGIASLRNLSGLDISETRVTNLSALQNLTELTDLIISDCNISNVSVLQFLTKLETLDAERCAISDLSPLQSVTTLKGIRVTKNPLTNLNGLQSSVGILSVIADSCQINNISALQNLTMLINLSLITNQVSNITPLQNLTRMETLFLSDNQISNVTALQSMSNVAELLLNKNQVTNLNGLQGLSSIYSLHLDRNQISDLTPLKDLNTMSNLKINDNSITTMQPIVNGVTGLTGLIILAGNNIPQSEVTAFESSHPNVRVN